MDHYFVFKELDLKIKSRRYLSTFPNTDKSCSYSYYYEFIDGDFVFLQCKDNNRNIKSPESCTEYTLYKYRYSNDNNDNVEILKKLVFYNKYHKMIPPFVHNLYFKHDSVLKKYAIYIKFSNDKTYEFDSDIEYDLTNCETWKESTYNFKDNIDDDVIDDIDNQKINEKLELCINEDYDYDYNYHQVEYEILFDKINNVHIALPKTIPLFDPYSTHESDISLYIYVFNGDNIEKYDFEIKQSLCENNIEYANISYESIKNKTCKIGYIDIDMNNGYSNDYLYIM